MERKPRKHTLRNFTMGSSSQGVPTKVPLELRSAVASISKLSNKGSSLMHRGDEGTGAVSTDMKMWELDDHYMYEEEDEVDVNDVLPETEEGGSPRAHSSRQAEWSSL